MNEVESFRVLKVLVRGVSWYINNLGIVIPISFIAALPELFCHLIYASVDADGGDNGNRVIVETLVLFLASMWLTGFLTHAAVTSMSSGQKPSLNDSLSRSARSYFPMLIVALLLGLAIVLGMVALIIPGLVLWVMYWVAIPAVVVERRGILESFGRSQALTSGHRWKVLWVLLSAMLLAFVLSTVIGLVFHIPMQVTSGGGEMEEWSVLTQPQSPVAQSLDLVLSDGIFTAIVAASFVDLRSLASARGNLR